MKIRLLPLVLFFGFVVIIFLGLLRVSFADDIVDDLQKKIREYEQKIQELQNKEKTLNEAIEYLNSRIYYTELKIQDAGSKIRQKEQELMILTGEVETMQTRIYRVSEALKEQERVLEERLRVRYKSERVLSLGLFLDDGGLSDIINRIKYLRVAQEQDSKMLSELKETKQNFTSQKVLLEDKKKQVEHLKQSIEEEKKSSQQYKLELDDEKSQKQTFLAETKSDEATYQELLREALAEINALNAAVGRGVLDGPVKKGDPIALVGNSGYPGCSTGAHLHFEIREDNKWVDPSDYLESKTVYDATNNEYEEIGDGDWDWPLSEPITLTQDYGKTPYSWRYTYSSGIHTGFDMVSRGNQVIYAPADGELYSTEESCGSSTIKIKYIVHNDNIISYYLHVQ